MKQDVLTITSLFETEMYKYINHIEELSDLEDLGPYGGNTAEIAKNVTRSREKLKLIKKIAKAKLDIDLPIIPIYCNVGGTYGS